MSPRTRGKYAQRRSGGTMPAPNEPGEALFVFSRDRIRELDRIAAAELGIPSILLMEHASLALARHVQDVAPVGGVLIVCGKGNNAGDGFGLARHLFIAGRRVQVVLSSPASSYSADAAVNLAAARQLGVPVHVCDAADPGNAVYDAADELEDLSVIVDALLGTGLAGAPREEIAALIRTINALGGTAHGTHGRERPSRGEDAAIVIAVDIPSGLDADTGRPGGDEADVVQADRTVTFVGLKKGFLSADAQRYLGDIHVEQIGTPRSLSERLGEQLAGATHLGEETTDEPRIRSRRPGADRRGAGNDSKRRSR